MDYRYRYPKNKATNLFKSHFKLSNKTKQDFIETRNTGYNIRKNHENGLNGWQPIKTKYYAEIETFPVNREIIELAKRSLKFENDDMESQIITLNINDEILDNSKDTNHFIIQLLRLCLLSKGIISYVKLMQIAYNIGQAEAVIDHEKTYSMNVLNFIHQYNLFAMTTFI